MDGFEHVSSVRGAASLDRPFHRRPGPRTPICYVVAVRTPSTASTWSTTPLAGAIRSMGPCGLIHPHASKAESRPATLHEFRVCGWGRVPAVSTRPGIRENTRGPCPRSQARERYTADSSSRGDRPADAVDRLAGGGEPRSARSHRLVHRRNGVFLPGRTQSRSLAGSPISRSARLSRSGDTGGVTGPRPRRSRIASFFFAMRSPACTAEASFRFTC